MTNKVIPIFYACDDAFVKYTIVSISSMMKNASKDYKYHIYILHTEISDEMAELEKKIEERLSKVKDSLSSNKEQ